MTKKQLKKEIEKLTLENEKIILELSEKVDNDDTGLEKLIAEKENLEKELSGNKELLKDLDKKIKFNEDDTPIDENRKKEIIESARALIGR